MKKYLLDPNKQFFKANLHCHSTISDGRKTPQELKEMYMAEGYSVIAYTDHDAFIGHSDLCDGDFLALNGFEMEITEPKGLEKPVRKTCHLCFVALEQDNLTQFCYHRSKYLFANAENYRDQIKFDESKPDFEREYTPECINEIIAEAKKNGFFVTYNHPAWSVENLNDYGRYVGMDAMEICNYSSVYEGFPDYNEKEYDDILRGGQRIYCIATDDNHNVTEDSFGGFTVINAEKLEYNTVTSALKNGELYASEGPEIKALWLEDGKLCIDCSDAVKIALGTGVRRSRAVYAEEQPLTHAEFKLQDTDIYVRITVTDASGKHANTIAYFIDELSKL